jgi:hypothetical protein
MNSLQAKGIEPLTSMLKNQVLTNAPHLHKIIIFVHILLS